MVNIANALAVRGYKIDILVLKPVGPLRDQVLQEIRIVSLDRGRIAFSLVPLIAYLRRERPSALLSLDEYTHVLALIARGFLRTCPRLVLRIGNMLSVLAEHYRGKAKILTWFVRWLFRYADCIVANSRGVADDVVATTGIVSSKVTVIFNPKPYKEIRRLAALPVPHPWLADPTIPVIVGVGRLREQKNFPLLIRAFAALEDSHTRLIIVGDGREREHLKSLVCELGINARVHFAGYQDNPYAWLARASVFSACSLWEGLPNVVLEALICGVPVIASDCSSGPREILAPDTDYRTRLAVGDAPEYARFGVLTPVGDEAALTEALSTLLADATLRVTYAATGSERSKDFDERNSIEYYIKALGV